MELDWDGSWEASWEVSWEASCGFLGGFLGGFLRGFLRGSLGASWALPGGYLGVFWRPSGVPKVSQKSPKGWTPDLGRSELWRVVSYAFLLTSIDLRL